MVDISILDDIKAKATKLINLAEPYATRDTAVYDALLNKVIVAGIVLDGVVSSTVSADTLTEQTVGIDYYYTSYHQSLEPRTLTVNILPTANCLLLLRALALEQQTSKGWFNISVHENGKIENVYRAWVISLPDVDSSKNAPEKSFVFGVKPMFAGISMIDQPTTTEAETYKRYGEQPVSDIGSSDGMVVNENNSNYEQMTDSDEGNNLPQE